MNNAKCVRSFFHQTESKRKGLIFKRIVWMHFTFRTNLRTECVEISGKYQKVFVRKMQQNLQLENCKIFTRKLQKGFAEQNNKVKWEQ
jgi:hypothetical protein